MRVWGSGSPESHTQGPMKILAICELVPWTRSKEQIHPGWMQDEHVKE